MSEDKIYEISSELSDKAHINKETYESLYQQSIEDPETFWANRANEFVDWFKPWDNVFRLKIYREGHIRWFEGAYA